MQSLRPSHLHYVAEYLFIGLCHSGSWVEWQMKQMLFAWGAPESIQSARSSLCKMVKLYAKNNKRITMSKSTKEQWNIVLYLTLNNVSNFTHFHTLRQCCRGMVASAYRQKYHRLTLTASAFWIRLAEEVLLGLLCHFLLYFFFISPQSIKFTPSFLLDLMTVWKSDL